jgi:hypothetical protein
MPSTLELRKKARSRRLLLAIVDADGDAIEAYETADPDVIAVLRADGSVSYYAHDPDAQHGDDDDDDEDDDDEDDTDND